MANKKSSSSTTTQLKSIYILHPLRPYKSSLFPDRSHYSHIMLNFMYLSLQVDAFGREQINFVHYSNTNTFLANWKILFFDIEFCIREKAKLFVSFKYQLKEKKRIKNYVKKYVCKILWRTGNHNNLSPKFEVAKFRIVLSIMFYLFFCPLRCI